MELRITDQIKTAESLLDLNTYAWHTVETLGAVVARSKEDVLRVASKTFDGTPHVERISDVSWNPDPANSWPPAPLQPFRYWYTGILCEDDYLHTVAEFYETLTGLKVVRTKFSGITVIDGRPPLYPTPYNDIREQTIAVSRGFVG